MRTRLGWLLTMILAALAACTPPASEGGFDSPDPASKLYAIQRAGEQQDRAAIPDLVEQLGSDDPAVRMMSINALERITGERLGYNPYGSLPERQDAIEGWAAAVREGKFGAPVNTESNP